MNGLLQGHGPVAAGLLAVSLLGFGVYLLLLGRPVSLKRTIAKTLAVGALCVFSLAAGGPWLLVTALALSALGDAFLAHEGDAAFLGGLGSFLAAHIAYAVLFFSQGASLSAAGFPAMAAVALFAFGMGFMLVRKAGPLAFPVAAYVLAIAVMGVGAVSLGGLVLLGAALFMASDAILGSEKFLIDADSSLLRFTSPAVWMLYYAGQVLITLGLVA